MSLLTMALVIFGFREQPLRQGIRRFCLSIVVLLVVFFCVSLLSAMPHTRSCAENLISLKAQFSLNWRPTAVIFVIYFLFQLAQGAFQATPRYLLHDETTLLIFSLGGAGLALISLGVFYFLAMRGSSPRRLAVIGLCVVTVGCVAGTLCYE